MSNVIDFRDYFQRLKVKKAKKSAQKQEISPEKEPIFEGDGEPCVIITIEIFPDDFA